MGNISVIFRQGLIASLTGGCVYEPQHDRFTNVIHIYLWIFLLCYPLILYMISPFTPWIWAMYCLTIAILFINIKFLNFKCHNYFDKNCTKSKKEAKNEFEMKKLKETTYDKTRDNILETAESMDIGSFKNPFCAWSYPDTLPADGSPRLSLSSSSGSGRLVSNSINKKLDYSKGDNKLNQKMSSSFSKSTENKNEFEDFEISSSFLPSKHKVLSVNSESQVKNSFENHSKNYHNSVSKKRHKDLIRGLSSIIDNRPTTNNTYRHVKHGDILSCTSYLNSLNKNDWESKENDIELKSLLNHIHTEHKTNREGMKAFDFIKSSSLKHASQPDTFHTSRKFLSSTIHPSDTFSLSSYKETSPESEVLPLFKPSHSKHSQTKFPSINHYISMCNKNSKKVSIDLNHKISSSHEIANTPHSTLDATKTVQSVDTILNKVKEHLEDPGIKSAEGVLELNKSQSKTFYRKSLSIHNDDDDDDDRNTNNEKPCFSVNNSNCEELGNIANKDNAEEKDDGKQIEVNKKKEEKNLLEGRFFKDAMCQTNSFKHQNNFFFALDDAALKKFQIQQQQNILSSSFHSTNNPSSQLLSLHCLSRQLARSMSYSRYNRSSTDKVLHSFRRPDYNLAKAFKNPFIHHQPTSIPFEWHFNTDSESHSSVESLEFKENQIVSQNTSVVNKAEQDNDKKSKLSLSSSSSKSSFSSVSSFTIPVSKSCSISSAIKPDQNLEHRKLHHFTCKMKSKKKPLKNNVIKKSIKSTSDIKLSSPSRIFNSSKTKMVAIKEQDTPCTKESSYDHEVVAGPSGTNISLCEQFSSKTLPKLSSPTFTHKPLKRLGAVYKKNYSRKSFTDKHIASGKSSLSKIASSTHSLSSSSSSYHSDFADDIYVDIQDPKKFNSIISQNNPKNQNNRIKFDTNVKNNEDVNATVVDEFKLECFFKEPKDFRRRAKNSKLAPKLIDYNVNETRIDNSENLVGDYNDENEDNNIHFFQDENGKWYQYSFGSETIKLVPNPNSSDLTSTLLDKARSGGVQSSTTTESTAPLSALNNNNNRHNTHFSTYEWILKKAFDNQPFNTRSSLLNSGATGGSSTNNQNNGSINTANLGISNHLAGLIEDNESEISVLPHDTFKEFPSSDWAFGKLIKKWKEYDEKTLKEAQALKSSAVNMLHCFKMGINLDRQALLNIFDRNSILELFLSIPLVVLVSFLACVLLYFHHCAGFSVFLCFIVASSQYSLIKSVQPDSASPMHGYNSIITFSRPVYFCLSSSLYLFISFLDTIDYFRSPSKLFQCTFVPSNVLTNLAETLWYFMMLLPVLCTMGWLPQLNTFLLYLLEQINIHISGGSATTTVLGGFISLIRSFIVLCVLFILALFSISDTEGEVLEPNSSQHIVFSLYCACLVSFSYHLSRYSSDSTFIISVLRNCWKHINHEDTENVNRSSSEDKNEGNISFNNNDNDANCSIANEEEITLTDVCGNNIKSNCKNENDQTSSVKKSFLNTFNDESQDSLNKKNATLAVRSCTDVMTSNANSVKASFTSYSEHNIPSNLHPISNANVDKTDLNNDQDNNNNLNENNNFSKIINGKCSLDTLLETTEINSTKNITNNSDLNSANNLAFADAKHPNKPPNPPPRAINKSKHNAKNAAMLPEHMISSTISRLQSDLVVCPLTALFVFAISISTAFSSPMLQPSLFDILIYISASVGIFLHYIVPHLRTETPWMCLSHPVLQSQERKQFEVTSLSKVMWFEKIYIWLCFIERNILLPCTVLCAVSVSTQHLLTTHRFNNAVITSLVLSVCSFKLMHSSFVTPSIQYYTLLFTKLLFDFDFHGRSESFIVDYFFVSILLHKVRELMMKLNFVLTYIAPWQVPWGSAFHAFAQPFSVPHSGLLVIQMILSSLASAPLNPFLGSTLFIISYVRPLKFWEKDYKTKRVDHTNLRLASQFERNTRFDDDNLNSIFYEHLTQSLRQMLCGDIALGRWGVVSEGDCFVLASDYLNALVHVVEVGNAYVTFQLRGLEFRGTYCQQREVEAITEEISNKEGCCCCKMGHIPHFLSANASFAQRWMAWQVISTKYVVEGYSVSEWNAIYMLQAFETRKCLVSFYVKCMIYYLVRSPKLNAWLTDQNLINNISAMQSPSYADFDPIFSHSIDLDYDSKCQAITRQKFCAVYLQWIQYCVSRKKMNMQCTEGSMLVTLCFAMSLLGRRALNIESFYNNYNILHHFGHGLFSLFKGDIRITSEKDEWVFADMELLKKGITSAIRTSLKLHQDVFSMVDSYDSYESLYEAIMNIESDIVICYEGDAHWRESVLANVPALFSLRNIMYEGMDDYKMIRLNWKYLSFRLIKINRECVRSLWAGQLQELIFLRNNNSERGSIQNARQSLRNIINSSCDQPIGYPIYVSPLTTSFLNSNCQYTKQMGREISFGNIAKCFKNAWGRLKTKCISSCNIGRSMGHLEETSFRNHSSTMQPIMRRFPNTQDHHPSFISRTSLNSNASSNSKPSVALLSLVNYVNDQPPTTTTAVTADKTIQNPQKDTLTQRVKIIDPSVMLSNVNTGRPLNLHWPSEEWRRLGGRSGWGNWLPKKNQEGVLVHRWTPCHKDPAKLSHTGQTILLIKVEERFVPMLESGVAYLGVDG